MITAKTSETKLLGLDTGTNSEDEVQTVQVVIQVEDARKPGKLLLN